jgi:hypothetical protein
MTPGLAMTRSFGDVSGKNCGVIADPDIYLIEDLNMENEESDL